MEQYKKSGPVPATKPLERDRNLERLVEDLEQRVSTQSRIIEALERDLRKLRNDMRMAIATVNTVNSNNRRNG